jgi:elongation factor Ts
MMSGAEPSEIDIHCTTIRRKATMAEITAAAVKSLRERTGLPMMDCKKALTEANGDIEKAVELLRKAGGKLMEKRAGRATSSGRIALYLSPDAGVGAMIDFRCESAPVAANEHFVQLGNDLAQQLATGPGADSAEALLAQPSPSKTAPTLKVQYDDLNNRIREVFKIERMVRIDGHCGGYAHHNGSTSVLLRYDGGNAELAKDICMHIAAMRPAVLNKEELDPAVVAKEREILAEAARHEGKPENIIAKMVEGRLRNFYAECCLAEQPFVKDDKKTVGQAAKEAGMKLVKFVRWELPKE